MNKARYLKKGELKINSVVFVVKNTTKYKGYVYDILDDEYLVKFDFANVILTIDDFEEIENKA